MKKVFWFSITLVISCLLLLGFASCGKDVEFNVNFVVDGQSYASVGTIGEESIRMPDNPSKEGYTFDGWYWDDGVWERPFTANSLLDTPLSSDMKVYAKWSEVTHIHTEVTDAAVAPTDTVDGLTEGKHCSECGEVLLEQKVVPALLQGTSIKSASMNIEDGLAHLILSNATETFSFLDDVTVAKDAIYVVARDIGCEQVVNSKTVHLNIGDNTYYILVTNGDVQKLYTVMLRRSPMYIVSFAVNGGTAISNQTIEEGGFATEPTCERLGYTFGGWDYDFAQPITTNTTIKASWIANTNTPYKVEYYLQNLEGNDYSLIEDETEHLNGETNTRVIAEEKIFTHFTLNSSKSKLSGNINGEGTLVLKVYYSRNTYSVTANVANYGSVSNAGQYKYGSATVITTATANLGYEFVGWYSGNECLSVDRTLIFSAEKNVVAKFDVKSEMANFKFTSTTTTCNIDGVWNSYVTEMVVPDYVTSIASSAFKYCSSLVSITLPFVGTSRDATEHKSHFGSIFEFACYPMLGGWEMDYRYSIPESLTTVTITGGVSIKYSAFYGCKSLTTITIPNSIITIGDYAFAGCSALSQVYYGGTASEWSAIEIGWGNTYLTDASHYYDVEI